MAFFIKLSYSKVRAVFTYSVFYLPRQGRPFLVDFTSAYTQYKYAYNTLKKKIKKKKKIKTNITSTRGVRV